MSNEELFNQIKVMDTNELNMHRRALKLAHRICSTLGVVSIFIAILVPAAITIISALISIYVLGNLAVGTDIIAAEVSAALDKKINS